MVVVAGGQPRSQSLARPPMIGRRGLLCKGPTVRQAAAAAARESTSAGLLACEGFQLGRRTRRNCPSGRRSTDLSG